MMYEKDSKVIIVMIILMEMLADGEQNSIFGIENVFKYAMMRLLWMVLESTIYLQWKELFWRDESRRSKIHGGAGAIYSGCDV